MPGRLVGVVSRNRWVIPVTYLAAAKAGLVYVALTVEEMHVMLDQARASALVAEEHFAGHTWALLGAVPGLRTLYVVDDGPPRETRPSVAADARVAPFADLMTGSTEEVEVLVHKMGKLLHRGPQAMTGYLDDPEAFRFGWFHTGDLGWIDEENVVWFVDRRKDVIKTGGENVASLEVEPCAAGHPGVAECAVVGIPHECWTEAVAAFVRRSPGGAGDPVGAAELTAHCRERLTGFKAPKRFVFVDELPRSSSGKIQKFELRTA